MPFLGKQLRGGAYVELLVAMAKMSIFSFYVKFKKIRLHIDKELQNAAWYNVHKLILNKKKDCFENKLNKCIGKLKELWKVWKSLGLPNTISSCKESILRVQYDNNL